MIWAPLVLEQSISDCQYHTSFFSDHRYMLLKFHLGDVFARGPGVWKFNTSLLDSPEYCARVRSFWAFGRPKNLLLFLLPFIWWDQGKFFLREITRCFARARAAKQSETKQDLERQLKHLQRLFDGGDSSAFSQLCAVQEELRAIHLREARASQVRARCRWAEEGETTSSFSLSLEKKHRAKQAITSIRDPDTGLVHHDPFKILATWRSYYQRLFTAEVCDRSEQDIMLGRLICRLSKSEVESCEGELSEPECRAALHGMSCGKTPGSDGFPMEFFVSFWDLLGPDLVRILNLAYRTGQLSTSQRQGIIIVLYKKDGKKLPPY